jgi:pSer/pThr/pTyr-binding forkhead associated (FHA) protein
VQLRTQFRFATLERRRTLGSLRPSHDTRERALASLQRGYATGRLNTDTLSRRIDRALRADCGEELRALTSDIAAPPRPGPLQRVRAALPLRRAATRLPPLDALTAGRLVLGRSSGCSLVFADDSVSRRHAELRLHEGRWMLRDLDSLNGTWVNGRRVVEAEVAPGDEVSLGAARFRL